MEDLIFVGVAVVEVVGPVFVTEVVVIVVGVELVAVAAGAGAGQVAAVVLSVVGCEEVD